MRCLEEEMENKYCREDQGPPSAAGRSLFSLFDAWFPGGATISRPYTSCAPRPSQNRTSVFLESYVVYNIRLGESMSAAQKEVLVNVIRQSDTFHGFAHRLGSCVDRLEKAFLTAIEHEYERWNRLKSAKSEAVKGKKAKEYEVEMVS